MAETVAADIAVATRAAEQADAELAALPKVELTPALLYSLMQAELEFRNGVWEAPYATLMRLATQTRDPRLARRAAEMARVARQEGQTLAAVRLWRELAPQSDEAAASWLALAVQGDNLAEVEALIKARLAAATPAARGVAMYETTQFLGRVRDKAAAAAMLQRLLTPYENTFEARVLLAQNAVGSGDSSAALAHARAAVALKPDSEVGVLVLAQVTPDQDAVAALLLRFLAAHPQASEVRAAYGRLLVGRKQYAQGRTEFATLLAQKPDNAGALYALGYVSTQLNDAAGAERYFTRFMEVHEKNPADAREPGKVILILAQLAEARDDFPTARKWLEKIEDSDSDAWFGAQIKLAQLTAREGNVVGARAMLAVLKAGEPTQQAQLLQAEGNILREAGQVEAAYALLADGIKELPDNADLHYDYALIAEKLGRLDVMEASLRTVMRQAPDNHHAYNALGYSLADRNERLPEALELIAKALQMAPGDPFIMDSMGWVYYRMGKLNEAEAHLRRAYALRRDVEIAVHLGEVLWQKGMKADAQKLLREARAKDPKNDTLKSTLARLQLSL